MRPSDIWRIWSSVSAPLSAAALVLVAVFAAAAFLLVRGAALDLEAVVFAVINLAFLGAAVVARFGVVVEEREDLGDVPADFVPTALGRAAAAGFALLEAPRLARFSGFVVARVGMGNPQGGR